MAIPLIINGVTFQYPQQFDKNWGPTLTNWSSAVTSGMLQKAGGAFTLTSEVDFGSSFGMKVKSIKSEEAGIAATGFLRLANASAGIVWRNALGGADLPLTVNASNQLTFNGVNVGATTSLTDSHILVGNASNQPADVAMTGDISVTNAGVTAIGAGKIVNAQINASAAIALSKLAPTTAYYWYVANVSGVLTPLGVTASRAIVSDSNGLPSASSATATETGYLSGVTSALQTQLNAKLSLSGGTMSGNLNMASHNIVSLASGANSGEAIQYGQWIGGQTPGTTTSDSASAGNIGQYVSAYATGVAVGTSGAWNDLVSISLTAGDWDVTLIAGMNAIITFDSFGVGISTTPGNSTAGLQDADNSIITTTNIPNPGRNYIVIPAVRFSLASTTTVYAKQTCNYGGGGTPEGRGRLSARRVR